MATIADLLVKIGADTSDLRKELNATKRQIKTAFGSEAPFFLSRRQFFGFAFPLPCSLPGSSSGKIA